MHMCKYCLLGDYVKVLCVKMYVNVVSFFLYSAVSLTSVREWCFIRIM